MPWPITFNGVTYNDTSFAGAAYITGLPNLMQDLATHYNNGFTGSSTTSLTVGAGNKTLTVEPNRLFAVGQPVVIANTVSPSTIYMDGRVTAYNPSTGSLTVAVATSLGSGTFTAWTVSIGGARVSTTLPVDITSGGTGSTTTGGALTNLGLTAVAQTLVSQATQALMRTTGLGLTSLGDALATAASTSSARTSLGFSSIGDSIAIAASAAAVRSLLSLGALATAASVAIGDLDPVTGNSIAARVGTTSGALSVVALTTNQLVGRLGADIQGIGLGGSGSSVPLMNTINTYSAAQRGSPANVSYAASVSLDLSTSNNFHIGNLTGNITLANPTNQVAGQSGLVVFVQDGTGNRTITWGSNWLFENGIEPTLSTGANSIDVLSYYVRQSGSIICSLTRGFA